MLSMVMAEESLSMKGTPIDAHQYNARVALTGSSGFIGRHLVFCLLRHGHTVTCVSRTPAEVEGTLQRRISDYLDVSEVAQAISSAEIVIHLAARAHIMKDTAPSPTLEYRRANCDTALAVANASASVGVKRFIFVSSIGVNGNRSTVPFKHSDAPKPKELYAISKLEAEINLRTFCANAGLPLVIVRPPLVYGPACPGNFARLMRIIKRGLPLPLASISNRRSYISIRSLTNFLSLCVTHPNAVNELFLVSDDDDVSTPELVRLIANAMGKSPNLWPFPPSMLKYAAQMLGRMSIYDGLASDLQVDIEHTRKTLGWRPVQTVKDGIFEMVQAFSNAQG